MNLNEIINKLIDKRFGVFLNAFCQDDEIKLLLEDAFSNQELIEKINHSTFGYVDFKTPNPQPFNSNAFVFEYAFFKNSISEYYIVKNTYENNAITQKYITIDLSYIGNNFIFGAQRLGGLQCQQKTITPEAASNINFILEVATEESSDPLEFKDNFENQLNEIPTTKDIAAFVTFQNNIAGIIKKSNALQPNNSYKLNKTIKPLQNSPELIKSIKRLPYDTFSYRQMDVKKFEALKIEINNQLKQMKFLKSFMDIGMEKTKDWKN